MKRGSSVLQSHCDAAKRHTHPANTHTKTHTGDDAQATGSSPFPAATSLFSPDVSTKMASDLLIRLSEATQKAQMHPGSREEAEQQDEPGLALSPDGPGASPEPPSLTHTPDGNGTTDTLASDLLRKLAERQEVNGHVVRLKEEEEPMDVDTIAQNQAVTEEITPSPPKMVTHHIFSVKTEDRGLTGNKATEEMHPRAKMVDQCLFGLKVEDKFCAEGCPPGSTVADSAVSGAKQFHFQVNMEDVSGAEVSDHLLTGVKMENQLLFKAKFAERPFSGVKMTNKFLSGVKMEDQFPSEAKLETQVFSGVKTEEQLFFGAKMEDQFTSGAKMADQCLRAVLWQDMSVNLASTLLHQLSERVGKTNSQPVDRMTPPIRSSPVLKGNEDQRHSSPSVMSSLQPPHETQTSLSRHQTTGCSYFFRCHVCGFETEGQALFQSHMTEHRQWEHGSFSLHCCVCDHSTNQEAEMRAHVDTHVQGEMVEMRCPVTHPATASTSNSGAPTVATATQLETSTSEHRCRICQRSFPGQQELLVHFQGHRQGNQYRCDRCGHLTRTANKLVEHVRVHTGERPFTCDLCPYSAKRRDSLRLHCKVKHAAHFFNGGAADTPADVHTHRSYVHADNQRSNKHVQRLHTPPSAHITTPSFSLPPPPPLLLLHPSLSDRAGWRDLSPLLPITTLISLKQRSPSASSSSSTSSFPTKHSFLGYLGLTTSL